MTDMWIVKVTSDDAPPMVKRYASEPEAKAEYYRLLAVIRDLPFQSSDKVDFFKVSSSDVKIP